MIKVKVISSNLECLVTNLHSKHGSLIAMGKFIVKGFMQVISEGHMGDLFGITWKAVSQLKHIDLQTNCDKF